METEAPQQYRQIDFRRVEDKCAASKIEAIQRYILNQVRPGEKVEVIVAKPDTWYTLTQLGDALGYQVLESRQEGGEYRILIEKII